MVLESGLAGNKSDEELVKLALAGSQDAFRSIVERHKNYVFSLVLGMVRDRQAAEDLVQETFIKLYRALPGFRGEAKFTTWLYRLTVHHVTDYLRSRRKKPLLQWVERFKHRLADPAETPEEAAISGEKRNQMLQALERLPEKYRLILYLYHYRQLSYLEIAEVTNLPLKTVETRLYRGKSLLLKIWLEVHQP